MNIGSLIQHLQLLGSLKPGFTISTSTLSVVDHASWLVSYQRRFFRDNRRKTIDFVKDTIRTTVDCIITDLDSRQILLPLLQIAVEKIIHLITTYSNDDNVKEQIQFCVNISKIAFEVANPDLQPFKFPLDPIPEDKLMLKIEIKRLSSASVASESSISSSSSSESYDFNYNLGNYWLGQSRDGMHDD